MKLYTSLFNIDTIIISVPGDWKKKSKHNNSSKCYFFYPTNVYLVKIFFSHYHSLAYFLTNEIEKSIKINHYNGNNSKQSLLLTSRFYCAWILLRGLSYSQKYLKACCKKFLQICYMRSAKVSEISLIKCKI